MCPHKLGKKPGKTGLGKSRQKPAPSPPLSPFGVVKTGRAAALGYCRIRIRGDRVPRLVFRGRRVCASGVETRRRSGSHLRHQTDPEQRHRRGGGAGQEEERRRKFRVGRRRRGFTSADPSPSHYRQDNERRTRGHIALGLCHAAVASRSRRARRSCKHRRARMGFKGAHIPGPDACETETEVSTSVLVGSR